MKCHHEGYTKEFVDGFGLCSPGRWPPEARGHLQTLEERKHVSAIASVLEDLVSDAIGDVKHKSMELALGRLKGSPFSEEQLWRARGRICDLLPAPEAAREIPERQPFMLHMLGQSLKLLGEPDWEVLCQGPESFAEGVPLGCDGELKRTPQVFRARVKSRKLDETDFQPIMQNYSSAEMTQAQLEEKFKQDEALGRMIATTEPAARQEFQEVLVAALGAICKPNGEVRPLHDATHGVRINNRISVPDRLETPGPEEIVELITRAKATKQAAFCISADISAAHRCVKIRKLDWGRLGCKTCSSSQTLWINTVGTFGVSSASYHWSRLFGAVGRWALRILGQKWALQIIYVDDLHVVVVGPDRFKTLWLLLAAYEVAGTPFNYAKFKGGHEAEFVGYFLSYFDSRAGISERRCRWVLDWIAAVERDRWMITGRNLAEFVGRLTFVGRMVGWVRPFLAPLYAWKAFLNRGTTARAVVGLSGQDPTAPLRLRNGDILHDGMLMPSAQPLYGWPDDDGATGGLVTPVSLALLASRVPGPFLFAIMLHHLWSPALAARPASHSRSPPRTLSSPDSESGSPRVGRWRPDQARPLSRVVSSHLKRFI